jgi:hypothetical protein
MRRWQCVRKQREQQAPARVCVQQPRGSYRRRLRARVLRRVLPLRTHRSGERAPTTQNCGLSGTWYARAPLSCAQPAHLVRSHAESLRVRQLRALRSGAHAAASAGSAREKMRFTNAGNCRARPPRSAHAPPP